MLHFHVLIIENVLATLLVSTRTVVANISSGLCDKTMLATVSSDGCIRTVVANIGSDFCNETMFGTVGSDICNRTSVANISFGVRAHSNFTVSFV